MYLTDKQQHANFLPIQMIYFEKNGKSAIKNGQVSK